MIKLRDRKLSFCMKSFTTREISATQAEIDFRSRYASVALQKHNICRDKSQSGERNNTAFFQLREISILLVDVVFRYLMFENENDYRG